MSRRSAPADGRPLAATTLAAEKDWWFPQRECRFCADLVRARGLCLGAGTFSQLEFQCVVPKGGGTEPGVTTVAQVDPGLALAGTGTTLNRG